MALHSYLVGEVAEEFADGAVTRREALVRLARLGLTAAAATTLLSACSKGDDDTAPTTTSPTTAAPGTEPPGSTNAITPESIRFEGPDGELLAAWSTPGAPTGAVLVVHENRGLSAHIRDVVGRLAGAGFATLGIDLLSNRGGTDSLTEAEIGGALGGASDERLLADIRAGIDEIQRRLPALKIGMTGFCFGGGMTWNLLADGEKRLAAAVPFYGPAPADPDFHGSAQAAVLGIYAERDDRVNQSRERVEAAMTAAAMTHDIRTYTGTDHAFFNDTRPSYNRDSAVQAWAAMLDWFDRFLK